MNHRTLPTLGCFLLLLFAGIGTSSALAQKDEVRAFTEPTKRSQMNFREIGIIKSVLVKEGQVVKKGDILMVLDTEIEQAELDRLRLEAESRARLIYAEVDRDYKQKVLERKTSAGKRTGLDQVFSGAEIEEAELDLARAKAQIDVVNEELQAAAIRVKQQQAKLDKMVLRAEFDGVVESIKVKEGELSSLDTDKPAIIVVQKDPLRVVITPLMAVQVAKLELGQTMQVRYDGDTQWLDAKVTYKTPFADHASGTQTVWLELPNPEQIDAGRRVFVKVPEKLLSTGVAAAAK